MLEYEFMRTAFLAGAIVALVVGPIGYFLVLRQEIFAGHALSHVGFAGATGAILVGVAPLWGLLLFTLAGGLVMGRLGERARNRDLAIGIVLAMALGLGTLFLHFYTSYAREGTALLFGNVLGISRSMLAALMVMAVVSLAGLGLIARPLLAASLDPDIAEAKGVSPRLLSMMFLALVALAVSETVQVVGVLLLLSLLVAPPATASRLTSKVWKAVALAVPLALLETWAGLVCAYYTDWPVSFWISALGAALYFGTGLLPPCLLDPVPPRSAPGDRRHPHH